MLINRYEFMHKGSLQNHLFMRGKVILPLISCLKLQSKDKHLSTILCNLLRRGIFSADGNSWKFQWTMASLQLGSIVIHPYMLDIVIIHCRLHYAPCSNDAFEKIIFKRDCYQLLHCHFKEGSQASIANEAGRKTYLQFS